MSSLPPFNVVPSDHASDANAPFIQPLPASVLKSHRNNTVAPAPSRTNEPPPGARRYRELYDADTGCYDDPTIDELDLEARSLDHTNSRASPHPISGVDPAAADPNLITWDSDTDPRNPRNWTKKRKWTVTLLVSSHAFMSPLSSSMIAPALPVISQDFGVMSSILSNFMLSVFVLVFAVGPLFLGPLSEVYAPASSSRG